MSDKRLNIVKIITELKKLGKQKFNKPEECSWKDIDKNQNNGQEGI